MKEQFEEFYQKTKDEYNPTNNETLKIKFQLFYCEGYTDRMNKELKELRK